MKTLIIGDVHGTTLWKEAIKKESPHRVIILGDYFDTHEQVSALEQMKNFIDIMKTKQNSEVDMVLLLGNHDYHYLDGVGDQYSGFQWGHAHEINKLLTEHSELLQICYEIPDSELLCSHAGFTNTWLQKYGLPLKDFSEDVNKLFKDGELSAFAFQGVNMYGDDPEQGPLWVRPNSLFNYAVDEYRQIVGHTTVDYIDLENEHILIDTIRTSKEFLVYEHEELYIATI